ncbi:Uncharacterized protein OBRU01_16429 [Operophtera brumata]|uniref:Uncharacterized protein n=1 Tax=Operophtera brumata TaxID=104452 RepID=A0A0L7L2S0_OPEBR|nr:Uncharacterized protein OBRU01_16429 [Operophtera brumata]
MTPAPQGEAPTPMEVAPPRDGNRVVISGMSGLYPKSRYVRDLENVLYNKYAGSVPDLDLFDAQFFKVHYRLAGVSPEQLSGKKVGVYIGTCFSETEKAVFYVASRSSGLGIAGCNKSMFANRISYWLNAKGPSHSIDAACCSSTVALEQAYQAITRGECEAAIVGGANLCLHPQSSIHYGRKPLVVPSPKLLMCSFFRKLRTLSAVPEADKSELEALDKIFCKNRDEPLMVGSVMSNIGYGEAASGISAITKVLLGYHRGELAGNLNCETLRNDVAAIKEGRIQVLNEHQQFRRTYAAINSLSVTGINAHVLLHGHYKPKDLNRYKSNIPYLVTISGRQESSVTRAFGELKSRPIDPEQLALLQNIHETRITGHLGRGYAVLDMQDGKTISLSEQVDYFDDVKRPLWFVYSGMGSQWPGMGKQLMRLPIFAAAIERCRQVLEPKGIDIVHIITSPDKTIFDNILHSFVGIAAVQIGLTDVLRELGLVPNKIIGHSVGELGCAYADGCLSAEEMILSAYSRGLVSLETPFIRGSMAAVSLEQILMTSFTEEQIQEAKMLADIAMSSIHLITRQRKGRGKRDLQDIFKVFLETDPDDVPTFVAHNPHELPPASFDSVDVTSVLEMCPPEIEIACHNSADSCTISGPADAMQTFVGELVVKGIFAKEVPCSNIAYHSRYIAEAVLFEETSKLIPHNAVLVEIAPHGLLQAILKRSLPGSCTNIPLTRRGHPDIPCMVLEAVGKLYMEGYNPKVKVLYPKVEFPVSTGTPFLSYLVDWTHNEKWSLALYCSASRMFSTSCKFMVSVHDDEHSYLKGHVIRRIAQLPFSYALVAAWDTLAMTLKVPKKQLSVVFSDVHFYAQPVLHDQQSIKLVVSMHKGSGQFEIMSGSMKVATGFINSDDKPILKSDVQFTEDDFELNSRDVYRLFYEREYAYSKDDTAIVGAQVFAVSDLTRCGGVLMENLKFNDLPASRKQVDLKTLRFVPRFQSNIDTFTSLQIFTQIVAENINKDVIKIVGIAPHYEDFIIFDEMERVASVEFPGFRIECTKVIKNTTTQTSFENIVKEADLVLLQNLSNNDQVARMLQQSSCNNVFIINYTLNTTAMDIKIAGVYKIVSVLTDKNNNMRLELVVFRPALPAASTSSVVVRSEKDLASLIAARSKLSPPDSLSILSTYPPISGLKSLVKHWRKDSTQNNINLIMVNEAKYTKQLAKLPGGLAYNILENGVWGGEYYLPLTENLASGSEIILRSDVIGDLQSLKWDQAPAPTKAGVSVMVHYAGVNMNDVLRASGVIPMKHEDSEFGMEFSGVTKSGERVMGLVSDGAAQSHVIVQPEFMWPVPSYWTLEDAATVPLAYVYAYYIFHIKMLHSKTDIFSVLVHGGAGALGQALISVCLAKGYRVFTTVSDLQKKKFLRRLFPKLKDEDIGNSRDASFADMVLSGTGDKERGYGLVDISSIFFKPEEGKWLQTLMSEGIASGAVRPLSRMTYALHEVSRAFNLLAASRHRGRVLLRFQEQHPPAQRRLTCSGDEYHIIFCDEQPLGLQLADMLISSGAKKIHLHFTHPPSYLSYKQSYGDDFGQFISKKRAKDGLPATVVNLSMLETYEDEEGLTWYRGIKEAAERALLSSHPVLLTQLKHLPRESLVQQIATLTVPGLEGHHERFRSLCERLKLPALVLQPGLDHLQETVEELALRYSKVVLKRAGVKNSFYLLGFETGVLVALELAAILEEHGQTGTVFCIGDGPEEIKSLMKEQLREYKNEDMLQISLVQHMFTLMTGESAVSLENIEGVTWRQRVDTCVRTLLGHVPHSAQYARSLIEAAYARIASTLNYNAELKALKSNIVVLRALSPHSASTLSCTLQRYSQQPISIYNLTTPLAYVARDMRSIQKLYMTCEELCTFTCIARAVYCDLNNQDLAYFSDFTLADTR